MIRDERGGVMVETLVALPVIVVMFFALYMLSFMFAGHLIVLRAADAAARAAVVILPGNPAYYGEWPEKEEYVRFAAQLALLSSPYLRLADVRWNQAQGFDPLKAELSVHFDCSPFPTALLCGLDRRVTIHAAATLPYQGGFPDR